LVTAFENVIQPVVQLPLVPPVVSAPAAPPGVQGKKLLKSISSESSLTGIQAYKL